MGISNSNMAFGYRLTPDLASQVQATGPEFRHPPVAHVPRTNLLLRGRRPQVAERN